MKDLLAKAKAILAELQKQDWYPERKVIRGTLAGLVAAVVAAVGLSASPVVAALATLVVAKVTAYVSKPRKADYTRRVRIQRKQAEKAARK